MKSVWALYERTDFNRGNDYDYENYSTSCKVFENFDKAKSAMKNLLKGYASDDRFLFDGNGNIKEMLGQTDLYYRGASDDESIEDRNTFKYTEDLLRKLCMSEITKDDIDGIKSFYVTNYMYDAEIKATDNEITLLMKDDDDGAFNGVLPYIHTNMFVMDDENIDYFFYLEDRFQPRREYYSNLYIDLKKVVVE